MLSIYSTPMLIRHPWQLKPVVFLHWCLICSAVLSPLCWVSLCWVSLWWVSLSFLNFEVPSLKLTSKTTMLFIRYQKFWTSKAWPHLPSRWRNLVTLLLLFLKSHFLHLQLAPVLNAQKHCVQRPYFWSWLTLLWMSCERPRQVYEYISMGLGHSRLVHRRVAHD